jgi:lipopolysaccharide transport system ATP-binding protein
MSEPILRVDNIGKRYRLGSRGGHHGSLRNQLSLWLSRRRSEKPTRSDFWALQDISFDVAQGAAVAVIGKNGAGKSTLLKILSQITPPTRGRVRVRGRIASLLEVGTGFHPELTGRENVYLNGAILGMTRREIARRFDEIVAFAEVERFLDTPVKHYSSGMYVRLAFAIAAHIETEVLVIDEVLAVGDVSFQQKCLGKMGEAMRTGRTVLFVSHNLATVQHLCTNALLLVDGRLRQAGRTRDVVQTYLDELYTESKSVRLGERTDRDGTGEVRIIGVSMFSGAGDRVGALRTGDSCSLAFAYEARRPLRNLAMAWNVRDEMGQPIFRASSRDTGHDAREFPMRGELRCIVPRFPLVPGRYRATIEARVGESVVDYVRDAFVLTVESGDFFGTGRINTHSPVLLDHTWDVVAAPGLESIAASAGPTGSGGN